MPRLSVRIDGQSLSAVLAQALGQVVVQQQLSQPGECELRFFDLYDSVPLATGMAIQLSIEGERLPLFDGEITALRRQYGPDRGRVLELRAQDMLHRLKNRQPIRSHVQLTLSELARNLVADLGLQVIAGSDGPLWRQWIQHRDSDLQLLQQVASRSGHYFTLRGEELLLMTLEGEGEEVPLQLGKDLFEANVTLDSEEFINSVEARAWNPWRTESQSGSASTARSGRQISTPVVSGEQDNEGLRTFVSMAAQDSAQADAIAQAELDHCHALEQVLVGVAAGSSALVPGVPVRVSGLDPESNGRYVLTKTVHRFDRAHGYLTELDTAPPEPFTRPADTHITYGVVTQVDDPEKLGRVRVMLPCHGEVESEWLEVLLPAAGNGKGLIALPDVGDRVLLVFVSDDPAQAIVLGGLYGPDEPPDSGGVKDGTVKRFHFLTPGGQLLQFDDEEKSARLESKGGNYLVLSPNSVCAGNSDGSYFELTDKGVKLHATRDLEIGSEKSVVIRGQHIDFRGA